MSDTATAYRRGHGQVDQESPAQDPHQQVRHQAGAKVSDPRQGPRAQRAVSRCAARHRRPETPGARSSAPQVPEHWPAAASRVTHTRLGALAALAVVALGLVLAAVSHADPGIRPAPVSTPGPDGLMVVPDWSLAPSMSGPAPHGGGRIPGSSSRGPAGQATPTPTPTRPFASPPNRPATPKPPAAVEDSPAAPPSPPAPERSPSEPPPTVEPN